MRILSVHNFYRERGGEDEVAHAEATLLWRRGHEVVEYRRSNDELNDARIAIKLRAPLDMIWSTQSHEQLVHIIRKKRPDVAHFHNTFLRISPAAYYACQEEGVPVIQSLHNPRLMCPAASLFRAGEICEKCVGKPFAWPSIQHGCWRGSRIQTAMVAAMLAYHGWRGTWNESVDAYVVFTNFYLRKFTTWGLPADRLFLKSHFVADAPTVTQGVKRQGGLFVGRLDPYKGVDTMLRAWEELQHVPLLVRGEGHLEPQVRDWIASHPRCDVNLLDRVSRQQLFQLMTKAQFLVWPSEGFYETFGLVAVEAFACGLPVIASRIGVLAEIIDDTFTGLLFNPGDAADLSAKVKWALDHPEAMADMGRNARRVYEEKYTPERNYEMLMAIYEAAIAHARERRIRPSA